MKLRLIAFVIVSLPVLSGCSLIPLPQQSGGSDESAFSSEARRGSIWKTSDGGHAFEVKSKIDETTYISKADILSVSYHPGKEKVAYVSSVDNGIFKTEDAGESWKPIAFPPKRIYSFILDKNDPDNRMFASGVVGGWGKIFRTENGGEDWDAAYTEPGEKTTITDLSQHPKDTNVIFAGTSAGTVVKSVDAGDTWKNVGDKVDGTVSHFDFDSDKKLSLYLLAYEKKFYYSKDGGIVWVDWEEEKKKEVQDIRDKAAEASSGGNASLAASLNKKAADLSERNRENMMPDGIVSIAADPLVSGVVYAGSKKGFFISKDYGKYWYEINIIESAKEFPIRSIAINPENSKEIVFVAGRAFYKSVNEGETWKVTGLDVDRDASFVSYDPFDSNFLFVGLRSFK